MSLKTAGLGYLGACALACGLVSAQPIALPEEQTIHYEYIQATVLPFGQTVTQVDTNVDGSKAVVVSRAWLDPTDSDPTHNEIFLFDQNTFTFDRITHTTSTRNELPQISNDGRYIVWRSAFDHLGDGNGGQFELYEYDTVTETIHRLVDIQSGQVRDTFRQSDDGRYVVYYHPPILYRVNRETGETNVVRDSRFVRQMDINEDGSIVVFADRTATLDNGIWRWEAATGTTTLLFSDRSLTDWPRVDAAGDTIAFRSSQNFADDPNAFGRMYQVYDVNTGEFMRVANGAGTTSDVYYAEISPDGRFVYIESDTLRPDPILCCPLSLGESLACRSDRQLYVFDVQTRTLNLITDEPNNASKKQITDSGNMNYVSVAANGTLYYRTDAALEPDVFDFEGTNFELFLGFPTNNPTLEEERCPVDLNENSIADGGDIDRLLILGDALDLAATAFACPSPLTFDFFDVAEFLSQAEDGCLP